MRGRLRTGPRGGPCRSRKRPVHGCSTRRPSHQDPRGPYFVDKFGLRARSRALTCRARHPALKHDGNNLAAFHVPAAFLKCPLRTGWVPGALHVGLGQICGLRGSWGRLQVSGATGSDASTRHPRAPALRTRRCAGGRAACRDCSHEVPAASHRFTASHERGNARYTGCRERYRSGYRAGLRARAAG